VNTCISPENDRGQGFKATYSQAIPENRVIASAGTRRSTRRKT
jgi:hypothetical protein